MIRFECDYAEGAYPRVLEILGESNLNQTTGYGNDEYCQKAKELIKKACNSPNSDVHFMVGGTQTNATVIAASLRPHQGVISVETGHINVHETGAIEFSGHKVIALSSDDGKITADQIRQCVVSHWEDAAHEHMVQPGMVYISHPTENGTLYTKEELTKISQTCKEFNLPLFMDGARLGYGLMAEGSDITLEDLCKLCDIFYIGGTKIGALFGEALVINNESLKKDFRYFIKQNGAMLAKGRLLGIQFIALFE
ncbi:MAG: threonine aldolase family protein, partial [Anaerotignaceae bacterium]